MDGAALRHIAEGALGGIAEADLFNFYLCLDTAAAGFVRETKQLTDKAPIPTVQDRQDYPLPPDFNGLYVRSAGSNPVAYIKYATATATRWPALVDYTRIFGADLADAKETPSCFAIRDYQDDQARVEGQASAAGEAAGGECVLTADGQSFLSTVHVRDIVHNVTDGSMGRVLAVTDDTHLRTALFTGTANAWAQNDAFVIIPGRKKQLTLDAPSLEAGHTMTVPYLRLPSPVYSDYGFWAFEERSSRAIVMEACFLWKIDYDYDSRRDAALHALYVDEVSRVKRERARLALQQHNYNQAVYY